MKESGYGPNETPQTRREARFMLGGLAAELSALGLAESLLVSRGETVGAVALGALGVAVVGTTAYVADRRNSANLFANKRAGV